MSLYQKLQEAKSEEDVKDAYIKALGLKSYSRRCWSPDQQLSVMLHKFV